VIVNEDLLAFLVKNSSEEEIRMINEAIRLSYYSPESVTLSNNSHSYQNVRLRDYIRVNHPGVYKFILPIYKLVRRFR